MTDQVPAHYARGPSGASRWLICTDSPELDAQYEDKTTPAADEGTAAHWLLEQCLKVDANASDKAVEFGKVVKAGEETGCEADWPITGEMIESVQLAIDIVRKDTDKRGTRLFAEERVRLDQYLGLAEVVGGTADIILYLPRSKTLKVLDFKYGMGKFVDVKADKGKVYVLQPDGSFTEETPESVHGVPYNPQIGIYGYAALLELDRLLGEHREVKTIELGIIQPRMGKKSERHRTVKLVPSDFMSLEMALYTSIHGPRVRIAGDHCFFCKHKPNCEEHGQAGYAEAGFAGEVESGTEVATSNTTPNGLIHEVDPNAVPTGSVVPVPLDPKWVKTPVQEVVPLLFAAEGGRTLQELGIIRAHIPRLEERIKAVKKEIQTRWLHDLAVPGTKLVTGPGSRAFGGTRAEIDAEVQALIDASEGALTHEDFYEPETLKSPAQIEKAVGKSKLEKSKLGKLITRTEGGPVVADYDSDKPAYVKSAAFEAEVQQEQPAPSFDDITSDLL